MSANLIDQLKLVEDFRTSDGLRHPIWLVLLFVIIGTMNGALGYRACGDFVKRHQQVLIETFGIYRHGVPSYSTIRRVMMGVDFDKLVEKFNNLMRTAAEFASGIRGHWGIENRLHWVKDVVFKEDASTVCKGNAPANFSIVRAIAINIFRRNGYDSVTTHQRFLSHDIDKLLCLVE
jgi:hypothetical protein